MRSARNVLFEAALVAVVGLAFALACNALSPRGLRLTRNYFPESKGFSAPIQNFTNPVANSGNVTSTGRLDATLRRLEQHGLQHVASNDVAELFRDSRYEEGLLVFLDARDDPHYQSGHIPGAWQFNHYRAEQFLPTILPVCLSAQKVVVYCGGGTCEDSEFAAVMLRDVGVPPEKLFVYAGGITEWITNGLPVETGVRRSGQLLKPRP